MVSMSQPKAAQSATFNSVKENEHHFPAVFV